VRPPLDPRGCIGSTWAVGSRAWIWDFSSTLSTTVFSGGFSYNPTTSPTFASRSGSVENRNDSARQGLLPPPAIVATD